MRDDKRYKIQKWDNRYILLKRKSRWNILGFIALSVATFGILQLADWVISLDGGSGFMDFEMWTWKYIGCFDNSELAVAAKLEDENLRRSQIVEEYYL